MPAGLETVTTNAADGTNVLERPDIVIGSSAKVGSTVMDKPGGRGGDTARPCTPQLVAMPKEAVRPVRVRVGG